MGKIKCLICKKRCEGSVLKIKENKFIHRKCFLCHTCKVSLETGGYFSRDDRFYCRLHYLENFGVKCCKCGETAEGEVMVFLGAAFHLDCFRCSACSVVLRRGEKVANWSGTYLCQGCFQERTVGPATSPTAAAAPTDRPRPVTPVAMDTTVATGDDEMCTSVTSMMLEPGSDSETTPRHSVLSSGSNGFHKPPEIPSNNDETKREDANSINASDPSCDKSTITQSSSHITKSVSLNSLKHNTFSSLGSPLLPTTSYIKLQERENQTIDPRAQFKGYRGTNIWTKPQPTHFHVPETSPRMIPPNSITPMRPRTINKVEYYQFMMPSVDKESQKEPEETTVKLRNSAKLNMMQFSDSQAEADGKVKADISNPISASRSPGANYEPPISTRFRQHTDASPSRISSFPISPCPRGIVSPFIVNPQRVQRASTGDLAPEWRDKLVVPTTPTLTGKEVAAAPKSAPGDQPTGSSTRYYGARDFLLPSRARFSSMGSLSQRTYTLQELTGPVVRNRRDINSFALENYLCEEEFEQTFLMQRNIFNHLPEWKRNDLKRRVNLF